MCLIAFALNADPACPLLIAANRDEFMDRPTQALHRWQMADGSDVLAGRDLRDGGTWLGLSPRGRVAMLTNVRQSVNGPGARTRGELVTRWLQSDTAPEVWADALDPAAYAGFNLVVGDFHRRQWSWLSNRDPASPHAAHPPRLHHQTLPAGVYGLSNASLDTPWPKSNRLKQAMQDALLHLRQPTASEGDGWWQPLTRTLGDGAAADAAELPHTGVPDDMERALSSPFVHMPTRAYGTRSSLLVRTRPGASGWEVQMAEWTHDPADAPGAALGREPQRREWLTW